MFSFLRRQSPHHICITFDNPLVIKTEITGLSADLLASINQQLRNIIMKLSEIKTIAATAAKQSTEAFAELGTRIAALQKQIDDLVLDAADPDVTDEVFLADLKTTQDNIKQLAEIVPNPA